MPLLVRLLAGGQVELGEGAVAQVLASLLGCHANAREARKDDKGVLRLVRLLDPGPWQGRPKDKQGEKVFISWRLQSHGSGRRVLTELVARGSAQA
jgi:hypothetical protein